MRFKYHILAVSLIISVILWLSLNLNLSYEIDKSVPIKLKVDKPYAVASYIPLNLDVKIKGSGWNLIRLFTSLNLSLDYSLNPRNYRDQFVINTKQFLNDNFGLSQNMAITFVEPETLLVKIGPYEEKTVKLVPDVEVVCKDRYQVVGRPQLEPESIKVGGSSFVIGSLESIPTILVSYKNISGNVNDVIRLSDTLSNLIWRSQDEVRMKINVELSAEKDFSNVEIKVLNTPADKEVLLIPQYINVQIKGGVNQLSALDNTGIKASVDFTQLLNDTTGAVSPVFDIPDGMSVILSRPDRIQYVIKKGDK